MASLDILVPVFNEAESLPAFHARLCKVADSLDLITRIVYINDGSTDRTEEILEKLAQQDSRVKIVSLLRNFGHQAALAAGLDRAQADVVVMLDGDGQHPPELIPEMLRLHSQGYEVVQARRVDPPGRFNLTALTARWFYRLLNRIGEVHLMEGGADFRLLSKDVVAALKRLPEYHRFYRGLIPWLGFSTATVEFQVGSRIGGHSKYSLRKMLRFAEHGLFSFSLLPLKIGLVLGILFCCMAALEVFYIGLLWLSGRSHLLVPGWSSTIVILTFGCGALMILLGLVGIYVGMIFEQVKNRPIYIEKASARKPE